MAPARSADMRRALQRAALDWGRGSTGADFETLAEAAARTGVLRHAVVVEGESDRIAIEALAGRLGRDLDDAGVVVVTTGGTKSFGRVLGALTSVRPAVRLSGIYDAGEEADVSHAIERSGIGRPTGRGDLDDLRFFACDTDLEDELIRSLGTDAVLRVVEANGDRRSFDVVRRQPAHHNRSTDDVLHRFIGTRSGRKHAYASLLVGALDPARVPAPLARLLGGL